jgi:hypothetical protein
MRLPWAGTPSIGDGVVTLWSHHHYVHRWRALDATPSIIGSEIWWPICLVGPGAALCATGEPLSTAPLPSLESLVVGRPLAGTLADGVIVDDSRRVTRVRDGAIDPTTVILPADPAAELAGGADVVARPGALDGDILVWRSSERTVMRTDLQTGTHTTIGTSIDHRGLGAANGVIAWLDGTSVHVWGGATTEVPGATSIAVLAEGSVIVSAGTEVIRAGVAGAVTSLDATVVQVTADGCDLWATVQADDEYELRRVEL